MRERNPNIVEYEELLETIMLGLLQKGDLYGTSTNDIKTLGSMSDAVIKVISEDSKLNDHFLSLGLNYKLTAEEIKQIKERDPSYPMKGQFELNTKIIPFKFITKCFVRISIFQVPTYQNMQYFIILIIFSK